MKKKFSAMIVTISMVLSFTVIPTHATSFSAANKRKNAYDICLNTDSNFVHLKGNGSGKKSDNNFWEQSFKKPYRHMA